MTRLTTAERRTLRREYPLDAAPDDQECQRFDALADRIIGAIPVGAA